MIGSPILGHREAVSILEEHNVSTTFRDPAGELHLEPHRVMRRVRPFAIEQTFSFLDSPLRADLERSGDLIATRVVEPSIESPGSFRELWLEHPLVDPISYPWEWTRGQWRSAAELTLRIASRAVAAGWTLKDATPLNIVFAGPRPVLVDVLSFERRDPQSTVWLAYGQFVRTFLLPLIAAKYLSWPLNATLLVRDGYEPGEIYRALSLSQRLHPEIFDVVTLATLMGQPCGKSLSAQKSQARTDPELATHILLKRVAGLQKKIGKLAGKSRTTAWSEYNQTANHYSSSDIAEKQEFVKRALRQASPTRVLDIGANTGTYSRIAADSGAEVVALDSDSAALEQLWRDAATTKKNITTLAANIARPTPAAGWRNREHLSLLSRLSGKFDLVLMLAVIHHLLLREQLPLGHIADLCASLSNRWLVLEWVPPSDPMYQEWLRGRDELYGHLSEEDLLAAFAPFFSAADRCALPNGRVLFLFERTSVQLSSSLAPDQGREASPA